MKIRWTRNLLGGYSTRIGGTTWTVGRVPITVGYDGVTERRMATTGWGLFANGTRIATFLLLRSAKAYAEAAAR